MCCVQGRNSQMLIISKIEILEGRVKFQGLGAEESVKQFLEKYFLKTNFIGDTRGKIKN